jgi:glyoxylase-like metal-dependent hydrolase (beta-lactamase superfamily II)
MTFKPSFRTRAIAAFGALVLATAAHAAAPQVKTQAPGFYRTMLGDFEVTALFDGVIELTPKELLTNTTHAQVGKLLERSFEADMVPTSVNGYLINTGDKLVLIDTGAADKFGPTLGKLQSNLKAAGYQPEQVDMVLITHMHGDHVGGLVVDGKLAFPNATVHAGKEDADFWLSEAVMKRAPAEAQMFFKAAQDSLNPYVQAGKFKPITGNGELAPGIKAVAAHGHTPGHTTYVVESKGHKLVLWGDLMHVAAVQFLQPQVTISFDIDSKAAAAERKKAYADAVKGRYLVGSAHLPFPGLGHLRGEGKGYAWVPVDYAPVSQVK